MCVFLFLVFYLLFIFILIFKFIYLFIYCQYYKKQIMLNWRWTQRAINCINHDFAKATSRRSVYQKLSLVRPYIVKEFHYFVETLLRAISDTCCYDTTVASMWRLVQLRPTPCKTCDFTSGSRQSRAQVAGHLLSSHHSTAYYDVNMRLSPWCARPLMAGVVDFEARVKWPRRPRTGKRYVD